MDSENFLIFHTFGIPLSIVVSLMADEILEGIPIGMCGGS